MFVLATLISWKIWSLNSCHKLQRKCFVVLCGLIGSLLARPEETMNVFRHQTDFSFQMMFFKSGLFCFYFIIIFNMTQVSVTPRVLGAVCYSNSPVAGIETLGSVCSHIAHCHGMTSSS